MSEIVGTRMIREDKTARQIFEEVMANPARAKFGFGEKLAVVNVDPASYGAVILAGGHGALWDFPASRELAELIRAAYEAGGVIAAVSQGGAALAGVTLKNGEPLVKGKKLTAMTDREIYITGLAERLPFFPETELRKKGAAFVAQDNWCRHSVADGRLITGQNTASAQAVGELTRRTLLRLHSASLVNAAVP